MDCERRLRCVSMLQTPAVNLVAARSGESQGQKRLLLQLVRFGGARGGAGATGALHRTNAQPASLRKAFQPGQYVEMRAHVGWFFLDPDNFASIGMLGDGGSDLRARQRIKLVEEENCRAGVFAAAAFAAQLVAHFAAGDQNAPGVLDFAIGNERQKTRPRELLNL